MSNESWAVILIGIQLLSVVASAYYWNKRAWLRKAPILVAVVCGLVYALSRNEPQSSILWVLTISLAIGIGFYFSVWVQCKNEGDDFF